MRQELIQLLSEYAHREGCSFSSAFRDMLTDLQHIADEYSIDMAAATDGALEVYREEREIE